MDNKNRTFGPCPAGEGYGITLREYYAGLAMQGLLANEARCPRAEVEGAPQAYVHMAARVAIEFADALLAELSK